MQNPYAVERFIQEHSAHARAVAELQTLQRKAIAARRREAWESWLEAWESVGVRLRKALRRPIGARLARVSTRLVREGR
jgi:hypothetical protein